MALDPNYECRCQVPSPMIHMGEDTGLCLVCRGIYDERLYEMRLRQHVPNWTWDSIDEFLDEVDPNYKSPGPRT